MTNDTPIALVSLALEPKTPADAGKLARGLEQLAGEQARPSAHCDSFRNEHE